MKAGPEPAFTIFRARVAAGALASGKGRVYTTYS
jgi:hypothetical protein